MKKYIAPALTIIASIALDRWSKAWILANLYKQDIKVLPFLNFTYAENTGVAFGMFQDSNKLLLIATSCILAALITFRKEFVTHHLVSRIGYWFVIGGAIGNIWDRISYKFVVDFVNLSFFPAIFNIADSFITVGAVLMAIGMLKLSREEKKQEKAKQPEILKNEKKTEISEK